MICLLVLIIIFLNQWFKYLKQYQELCEDEYGYDSYSYESSTTRSEERCCIMEVLRSYRKEIGKEHLARMKRVEKWINSLPPINYKATNRKRAKT